MSEHYGLSVSADPGVSRLMTLIVPRPSRNPPRSHAVDQTLDLMEELTSLFVEEFAQVRPVLMALDLAVGYRAEGSTTTRVVYAPNNTDFTIPSDAVHSIAADAPVFGPQGGRLGRLEFLRVCPLPSDALTVVLEPLLLRTANSISERWFRLHHHQHWIIVAAPLCHPDRGLLLAIDQDMKLQGVGFGAGSGCSRWEEFFAPISPTPTLRARTDVSLRLTGARDGQPWVALLTGPSFHDSSCWSADGLVQARPRLHHLPTLRATPEQAIKVPSLTAGMRRRVEEFIESHLDTPLSVEQIALAAGLSCSHFTRAFRNVLKMTPHRYIVWRRLIRAQELIKDSDVSLAEIALVTGFCDQSHLSRIFQHHMGESPSQFRRRHR